MVAMETRQSDAIVSDWTQEGFWEGSVGVEGGLGLLKLETGDAGVKAWTVIFQNYYNLTHNHKPPLYNAQNRQK